MLLLLQIDEAIFKKKWLQNEKQTLEAAIAAHGFKLKAILKDETFAEGLADKSVKQIETRLKKAALESLQERNGGKHSPRGGRGKPEALLSKEGFEKVLKIVFKKFEAVVEHPRFTVDLGLMLSLRKSTRSWPLWLKILDLFNNFMKNLFLHNEFHLYYSPSLINPNKFPSPI
jgi:hypothetical protein